MGRMASKGATGRVVVENVNVPGCTIAVHGDRCAVMQAALLEVLPRKATGVTHSEMMARVVPSLPEDLLPGGAKSGWWTTCLQLDLEAKGLALRDATARPLRWTRGAAKAPARRTRE